MQKWTVLIRFLWLTFVLSENLYYWLKMGDSKQVRVDNWGIFFLQRLQMFFSKTDYCDLTLQFEGNVQLKVHSLVMNACTEYFEIQEHSDRLIGDNTILMPSTLQAEVMVPIVNFMYTGMLEFQVALFERLFEAAEIMKINVLTKLLQAQKPHLSAKNKKQKVTASLPVPKARAGMATTTRKLPMAESFDLPKTLPGRKLPVWKRNLSGKMKTHESSKMFRNEPRWNKAQDPLTLHGDYIPKPTRFEWPEDLPEVDPMMDLSSDFGNISYNSKPLMTKQDELKCKGETQYEDDPSPRPIAHVNIPSGSGGETSYLIDLDASGRIISKSLAPEDENVDNSNLEPSRKRKRDVPVGGSTKRIKICEGENDTSVSVYTVSGRHQVNPTKLVSDLLRKFPTMIKNKKNIKVKIMTTPAAAKRVTPVQKKEKAVVKTNKPGYQEPLLPIKCMDDGPWYCTQCHEQDGQRTEFILYYLYRKHMTDVHHEKFDPRVCKFCGYHFNKQNLLTFHLYTKHNIKPASNVHFPSCPNCPFITFNQGLLDKHLRKHTDEEMRCLECSLAFLSPDNLASHLQITTHAVKSRTKSSFDCQYCMKRFQSAFSLLSHINEDHPTDGRLHGIVGLDDIGNLFTTLIYDDEDDDDEEDDHAGEYIVPEIIDPEMGSPDPLKDKVKIISDVKVESTNRESKRIDLEPSSEAEALSNVASGIATSLGLVDIVVLDENQQYIIHDQEGNEQGEFILPELGTGPGSVQQRHISQTSQGRVVQRTGGQTTRGQTVLAADGTEVENSDELVMVLTDHDYQDEQNEEGDNSNIVVLYSHPVDGQQGQFITSQGNIMVNSETGMLEIHNGETITTTSASQIVMSTGTSGEGGGIETIEMIQREIDSHENRTLKQEPVFEVEDRKPEVPRFEEVNEENNQEKHETHEEEEEETHQTTNTEKNTSESIDGSTSESKTNTENQVEEEEEEEEHDVVDNAKQSEETLEEPMDIDECPEENPITSPKNTDKSKTDSSEKVAEVEDKVVEESEEQEETSPGHDVPPSPTIPTNLEETENSKVEESRPSAESENIENVEERLEESAPPVDSDDDIPSDLGRYVDNKSLDDVPPENSNLDEFSEPMEVDGRRKENVENVSKESNDEETSRTSQEHASFTSENENNENQEKDLDQSLEEPQPEEPPPQEPSQNPPTIKKPTPKIAILDDWDDNDSQTSQEKADRAEDAVHKLMDDWDEDEDKE